jgi:hypothetical protein
MPDIVPHSLHSRDPVVEERAGVKKFGLNGKFHGLKAPNYVIVTSS